MEFFNSLTFEPKLFEVIVNVYQENKIFRGCLSLSKSHLILDGKALSLQFIKSISPVPKTFTSSPRINVELQDKIVAFSFKKHFDEFFQLFQTLLQQKNWIKTAGINQIKLEGQNTKPIMDVAFADLETLMQSVDKMVKLALKISNIMDGDVHRFRTQMLNLGMLTNADTLGEELTLFIQNVLKKSRILSAADVYCMFNRSRAELCSPLDLWNACLLLKPPFYARTFSNQNFVHDETLKNEKIIESISNLEKMDKVMVANSLKISPLISNQILWHLCEEGVLCVDMVDSTFWWNIINPT